MFEISAVVFEKMVKIYFDQKLYDKVHGLKEHSKRVSIVNFKV